MPPLNNTYFRLPNASTRFYADTGASILPHGAPPAGTMRVGAPTGPMYNPAMPASPLTRALPTPTNPSDEYTLLRKTRNPLLEALNVDATGRYRSDVASNDTALNDYTKALSELKAGNKATFDQENRTLDDVFSGRLASDLAGIRTRHADASRRSLEDALANADASRKSAAVAGGFGGSSYFARQGAALRSEAGSKLAADLADRERADVQYVRDAQGRLIGVRRKLGLDMAADSLLPATARAGLRRDELGNLGILGALDERNNIYGLDDGKGNTPYFPAYAPASGYTPSVPNFGGDRYTPPSPRRFGTPPPFAAPRMPTAITPTNGNAGGFWNGEGNWEALPVAMTPQQAELARLRSFYGSSVPTTPRAPFSGVSDYPTGYDLPDNYDSLTGDQAAEYERMLATAPQYYGEYQ